MNNNFYHKYLKPIIYDILSAIFISIGVTCFFTPNQIAPGGFSGIAIMVNYLTNLPVSFFTFIANVPVLIIAAFIIGKKFMLKSVRTIAIQIITLRIMENVLPQYEGEKILASIFGGLFVGLSLTCAFIENTSTGGSDMLSRLAQKKFRNMPIGKMIMIFDMCIISASMLVFKNIESGLYALIAMYTTSKIIDSLLYGLNKGKVLLIFTSKTEEMTNAIFNKIKRGVTLLQAKGGYSKSNSEVILCAVRPNQYANVEDIVKSIDQNAFLLTLDAREVQGNGFKNLMEQKIT